MRQASAAKRKRVASERSLPGHTQGSAEIQGKFLQLLRVSRLCPRIRRMKKPRHAAHGRATWQSGGPGVLLSRSTRLGFHFTRQLGQHP